MRKKHDERKSVVQDGSVGKLGIAVVMTPSEDLRILTINSGSSSLKIAQFLMGKTETLELSAHIERIGQRRSHRWIEGNSR